MMYRVVVTSTRLLTDGEMRAARKPDCRIDVGLGRVLEAVDSREPRGAPPTSERPRLIVDDERSPSLQIAPVRCCARLMALKRLGVPQSRRPGLHGIITTEDTRLPSATCDANASIDSSPPPGGDHGKLHEA